MLSIKVQSWPKRHAEKKDAQRKMVARSFWLDSLRGVSDEDDEIIQQEIGVSVFHEPTSKRLAPKKQKKHRFSGTFQRHSNMVSGGSSKIIQKSPIYWSDLLSTSCLPKSSSHTLVFGGVLSPLSRKKTLDRRCENWESKDLTFRMNGRLGALWIYTSS